VTTEGTDLRAPQDAQLASLRQENELLRAQCEQFLEQRQQDAHTIESLQHQLQQLLRRLYGRSAEKIDPKQLVLFEKLLEQLAPPTPASDAAPALEAPAPASKSSNGHGRRRLPADLPRKKVIHDLPEEEKPCPCCGELRHVIGQEIDEKLDYVPAKVTVIEHVRLKYACRACEQQAAEGGPQIVVAEKPLSPIEKGLAAPGLLAHVIVSKYSDHLPLYRLERILERHGIQIARSTLCDWMAQSAMALRPLYDLMVQDVRGSKVIHTDDTPVDVLDKLLKATRTGRFWVYVGDKGHPNIVFAYTPSRCRDGPMEFLKDWGSQQRVYLQADAFGGYDGIYRGEAGGLVIEVACWAHARRKFYDARHSDAAISIQALAYIRLLYDVEDLAKQSAKENQTDLAVQRCRLRQEKSVPLLEQFKTWLESRQAQHGGPVLPKSPMGQAIQYALNQWAALCVYTTDGDLNIDNNLSENALRRVALGRKNWLFCGSDNGGNTAAVLFSLIATCQRHKVDPFVYLRDVLDRISATPVSQLPQLLPDQWKAARTAPPVAVAD
jgi:transposase